VDDEEDAAYVCDDCGEEFETQTALEGHEVEGCWASPDEEDEDV
jgi:DNA-directed RNA polymerase subunit RPC12/RpoP